MAGFLTELKAQRYGCLQDVACTLTPLHAFIGPNDSGKSTLLRLVQSLFRNDDNSLHAFAAFDDGSDLRLKQPGLPYPHVKLPGRPQIVPLADAGLEKTPLPALSVQVGVGALRAHLVRLDPDALRRPSGLIPDGASLSLQDRGDNLAGLYDALRDRSVERFMAISREVTKLFPTVKVLGLRTTAQTEKVLTVTLVDGTEVRSYDMSEGLLYYLAFAILSELERPAVYLVEEPENGLHPSRIADVVRMLRAVTEDPKNPVQVLMATHSPLVVNELRPDEVTIVTRDLAKGTQLHPINKTPHFAERSKVYALGELWLAYADGKTEAPLFDQEGR